MPSLISKIQAKIELFRLEQRYTRNRNRRSAFVSNAIYVDGEYIYQTPNTTGSSTNSHASSSASSSNPPSPIVEETSSRSRRRHSIEQEQANRFESETPVATQQKKRLNRFSSMPGFGSMKTSSTSDWRPNGVDVRSVR
ncbi:hypothetical protein F4821DRAFT_244723 [Hypoxylon rubiginosum]|uniref:Uncharacterized protein n=1 Tax=Hypoxylon rubiginosum TaxID=110542 RepID=A0ACC0CTQ6_9PEZI|nr:hypothetical protein F4821DRAFT_244723 [Hypoxylon rubiginosum]